MLKPHFQKILQDRGLRMEEQYRVCFLSQWEHIFLQIARKLVSWILQGLQSNHDNWQCGKKSYSRQLFGSCYFSGLFPVALDPLTSQNSQFPTLCWVTGFGRVPLAQFWASLYCSCGEPLLWQLFCSLNNLSSLLSPDSYSVHNLGQQRPQALLLSLGLKAPADADFFRLSFCNNLL